MQVLAHIAYYASKSSHRARCDISEATRPTRDSDTQFVDIVETIIIRFLEALGDNQIDKLCCESNSTPTQADGELSNCPTKA
jgi:hypothetical protein